MFVQPALLAFAALFFVMYFAACDANITLAVLLHLNEPTTFILLDLPPIFGHQPMHTLVPAKISADSVTIRLYALYKARIGWNGMSFRSLCVTHHGNEEE
jgi:hypothetical protein